MSDAKKQGKQYFIATILSKLRPELKKVFGESEIEQKIEQTTIQTINSVLSDYDENKFNNMLKEGLSKLVGIEYFERMHLLITTAFKEGIQTKISTDPNEYPSNPVFMLYREQTETTGCQADQEQNKSDK